MDEQLLHLLLDRLGVATDLGDGAVDLVLAACEGPVELDHALAGKAEPRSVETVQPELELLHPPGAYVRSVSVQGFRGVGPAATLDLTPGPGLTLIVGRNGSGKSSFAEGLELLMTGLNSRWVNRTKIWTQGWQNLHWDQETKLSAELVVDGEKGTYKLSRAWEKGAVLQPGTCSIVRGDGSKTSLDDLGWTAALSRYRPFLSYNELGSMFDELKTMYDALAAILGLEDLEGLTALLRSARLERERASKDVKAQIARLLEQLEGVEDDERVKTVVAALSAKRPDLDAIELALEGVGEEGDPAGELATLRALCSLKVAPEEEVEAALSELAAARAAVKEFEGTDAGRAASLSRLLEVALQHDANHQETDCPVCGTEGVIDEQWRAESAREVLHLQQQARAVESAERAVRAAERRVADLLPPAPPPVVDQARSLDLDPNHVEDAWGRWREDRDAIGDPAMAERLPTVIAGVRVAVHGLAEAAEKELDHREDVWRPVAKMLQAWLPAARAAVAAGERLTDLKEAEAWVKATAADVQAERLAPIAGAAKENWEKLRQDSNVSLEGFHLRKSGNTRAAEVDVRVDGSEASAFGVMSQGELHALAVSVFLPRAGLADSPFRFMVIDDPVQSMDPAKVDGLARVLDAVAAGRQVIVFTHDERLPEAVRRLGIDATVLEVTRRPQSVVEVRTALDPVERYLEDARALVRTEGIPREAVDRVVPGLCRHALEAGSVEAFRRRRLARGDKHSQVEDELRSATTLYMHLSLALFDDPSKGGDVLKKVNTKWGSKAGNAVVAANKGVHEVLDVDLKDLIRDTAILARDLAGVS